MANNGLGDEQDVSGLPSYIPTPAEEADALRIETKAAFLDAINLGTTTDKDEDDLLTKRDENLDDSHNEEDQYRRFLLDNVGEEEVARALALRGENDKSNQKTPKETKDGDETFLKKYVESGIFHHNSCVYLHPGPSSATSSIAAGWIRNPSTVLPTLRSPLKPVQANHPMPSRPSLLPTFQLRKIQMKNMKRQKSSKQSTIFVSRKRKLS